MAEEIKLPALGENVPGGDVVEIKVAVGDTVTQGQDLIEVEAEKSTVPVPSPLAGKITKVLVQKGQKITTGQGIVVVESANGQARPAEKQAEPESEAGRSEEGRRTSREQSNPKRNRQCRRPPPRPVRAAPVAEGDVVPAGPATRRLAREWGVDLHQVPGSGPLGRVTQDDVKAHVRNLAAGGSGGAASRAAVARFREVGTD